jgi:DNA-binding MarR family transcriptional regulator
MARKTKRELVEELTRAGRAQSTAVVLFHGALAAKQGLVPSETKALELLDRFGPMTAGELGQRTGLAPASITGLVDRLEQKGFAKRVKDPRDGRRVLVEHDPSGAMRFAPHFGPFLAAMEKLYQRFTAEELETILRFVEEATAIQTEAARALAEK